MMNQKYLRLIYIVACLTMLGILVVCAKRTRYDAHPDEYMHINAFCYFEHHWGIPDLNIDGIFYSPTGETRVYSGEVVYQVYGKINALIRPLIYASRELRGLPSSEQIPCDYDFRIIRYENIILYAITLLAIYQATKRSVLAWIPAALMLCIPQAAYLYSYANSDAWGLSFSVFLFLYAITRLPFLNPSRKDAVILGLLTGIVLISKKPFWISFLLSYTVIAWGILQRIRQGTKIHIPRWMTVNLLLCAVTIFVVAAPLRIFYPLSQGDFSEEWIAMKEIRAWEVFKPSHPTFETYHLAKQGFPFSYVLQSELWRRSNAISFYGFFGYFQVLLPEGIYNFALIAGILSLLTTITVLVKRNKAIPSLTRWLIAISPISLLVNIGASLYNSWRFDFQPQGRYLFGSLIAIGFLLAGTIEVEPKWLRIARTVFFTVMVGLCAYILWTYVATEITLIQAMSEG